MTLAIILVLCETISTGSAREANACFSEVMMMVDSSQMGMFGKAGGQFLHACWWLYNLILDAHTLLRFGQANVLAQDDLHVAHSFCLLWLSFEASCLSALNLRLAFLTS